MYTPSANRTRMLFTVWAKPKTEGVMRMYVGPEVFSEFYPIEEKTATSMLGPQGWREVTGSEVVAFIERLDALFEKMDAVK